MHVREKSKIRIIEKAIQKEFERGTLPSGKDICQRQLYRVIDDIERVDVMEEEIADVMPEVVRRWSWLDKEELIKRVVSREFGRFLAYYADAPEIEEVAETKNTARGERQGGRQGGGPRTAEEGYRRLFINVGKIDGFYAKEIIGLINRNVKGQQVEIGRIDLLKNFAFVEVAADQADDVIRAMKHGVTVRGRSVVCDEADKNTEDKDARPDRKRGATREPRTAGRTRSASREDRRTGRDDHGHDRTGRASRREDRHPQRRQAAPQPPQKHYTKEDWMKFLHPDTSPLRGEEPDFSEEGWARRKPKKKK